MKKFLNILCVLLCVSTLIGCTSKQINNETQNASSFYGEKIASWDISMLQNESVIMTYYQSDDEDYQSDNADDIYENGTVVITGDGDILPLCYFYWLDADKFIPAYLEFCKVQYAETKDKDYLKQFRELKTFKDELENTFHYDGIGHVSNYDEIKMSISYDEINDKKNQEILNNYYPIHLNSFLNNDELLSAAENGAYTDYSLSALGTVSEIYKFLPSEIIFKDITKISCSAFENCQTCDNFDLGPCTTIREFAFADINSCFRVDASNVEIIEAGAFSCCPRLDEIKLSNKLTTVDSSSFTDSQVYFTCESEKVKEIVEWNLNQFTIDKKQF